MDKNLITEISRIKSLILEQTEPPGDDWDMIKTTDKDNYPGYTVKQDKKGFYYKSKKKTNNTTTTETPEKSLPEWVKNFPCLTEWGKKIINAEKDNEWVRHIDVNNNTYWFKKDGSFEYIVKDKKKEDGKWKCDEGFLLITMDNGDTYSSKERPIDRWSFPLDPKALTTSGDPYQYIVINGQWNTKSWRKRGPGKIIKNWISLKNNSDATKELDRRHPYARPKNDTVIDNKTSNNSIVTGKDSSEPEIGSEIRSVNPNDV
jgi:hypothetical protein